jgi:RNA polymerase sigma-70 factor (ECF subfamily)
MIAVVASARRHETCSSRWSRGGAEILPGLSAAGPPLLDPFHDCRKTEIGDEFLPTLYREALALVRTRNLPLSEQTSDEWPTTTLEQIVLPHLDAAHNLARWLLGDAARAEDVVQDAVLRAITYFHSYRGGDAKAWFLQIVRNTAYSATAARRKSAEVPFDDSLDTEGPTLELPDPAPNPEATLDQRQQRMQLDEALSALPVALRECLVLRELEELSYKDIVRITGLPMGTVMSRLWRARQMLLRTYARENQR